MVTEKALRYDEKTKDQIIPSDVNNKGFEPFSAIVYFKVSCFKECIYSVFSPLLSCTLCAVLLGKTCSDKVSETILLHEHSETRTM